MFVDDVSGIGLWSDWGGSDTILDELPISRDLRDRIRAWVDAYTRSIWPGPDWTVEEALDHDRTGYRLCEELQSELGEAYTIEYRFHTAEIERELG